MNVRTTAERASALIIAVTFVAVLVGVTTTVLVLTLMQSRKHMDRLLTAETRYVGDSAIAIAIGNMSKTVPVPVSMSGTIASTATSTAFVRGVPWVVYVSQLAADHTFYKVSVAAGNTNQWAVKQAIVQVPVILPPPPNGAGSALLSINPSWVQAASVTIDGTNYKAFGGSKVGSGNSNAVVNGGTFSPKGTIIGPVVNNAPAGTGVNQVPASPGQVLNVPDSSLLAPVNPTYFTDLASLNAWIAAHTDGNGYIPNTSPIYYTFDGQDPTSLPMDPNKAYIVINHRPASPDPPPPGSNAVGTANCGFIASAFTGILIFDNFDHMQHGPLNGSCICLGDYSGMMKIQGKESITFSTGAIGLALLGSQINVPPGAPKVVSYVETPSLADSDVVSAIRACNFVVGTSGSSAGSTSAGWQTPPQ